MGGAVIGATYYLQRLARSQDVVWSRKNPFPHLEVPEGHTVKMHNPTGAFEHQYVRT
ncbi:hypothetical protein BCR33DRAFT_716443, partial [Rhizoclosmatium globosum]